jgi:DNA-binding response OmpR family regulator
MQRKGGASAPVILVTGREDYGVDVEAMKLGATEYLVKSQLNGPLLDRSIRYALERWKSEAALRNAHDQLEMHVQERTIVFRNEGGGNEECAFSQGSRAMPKTFGTKGVQGKLRRISIPLSPVHSSHRSPKRTHREASSPPSR